MDSLNYWPWCFRRWCLVFPTAPNDPLRPLWLRVEAARIHAAEPSREMPALQPFMTKAQYCMKVAQYHVGRFVYQFWGRLCPAVIVQRELQGTLFALSLKCHTPWLFYGDLAANAENPPFPTVGHVWDLGCNIGLYSVKAARAGCRVTAFDISITNVLCLNQTARLNGLDIKAQFGPVTVKPMQWSAARSGHSEESMTRGGSLTSMTYLEVAERCGLPDFIKMDIQGGESEFLQSTEFREWVLRHGITIYLETHNDAARWVWPEFRKIGNIHYLLSANE